VDQICVEITGVGGSVLGGNQHIAFYRSPVGRSFTSKMPVVSQKAMMEMQQLTQQFMPKLQAAMQELIKEVQSAK
jgi:hypothetical protein